MMRFLTLLSVILFLPLAARAEMAAPPDNGSMNLRAPVACTMDAKLCPDGSYVSRRPPNCDFAPCPSEDGSREPMPPQNPMPVPPQQPPAQPPAQPPGGDTGFAPESMPMPVPPQALTIDPNDAQCVSDSECVTVQTQCGSCDCGTPVNQMFALKYRDRLMKLCDGYNGPHCEMMCPQTRLVCHMGRCQRQ